MRTLFIPLMLAVLLLIAATAYGQTVNRQATWTDNSSNEANFIVQKCNGNCSVAGTFTWTQIGTPAANATSFLISNVPVNTTTSYRVGATNSGGTSWSNIFVDVIPGIPPTPPTVFNLPPCKILTLIPGTTNYSCS